LTSGVHNGLRDHLRASGREARFAAPVVSAGAIGPNFVQAPSLKDIWLRDFCGVPALDEAGEPCMAKFRYRPSYLPLAEAEDGDAAAHELATALKLPVQDVHLILDGGNLTHDGRGTAICTTRILDDNRPTAERELRELLRRSCGINKLVILPEEPGDATGHIDGMVRFLSPTVVLVGSYPATYKEGHCFMDGVAECVREQLGPEYRVLRLPNDHPEDVLYEGIPSAVGNRVNFLRAGMLCMMPAYGTPGDGQAMAVLRAAIEGLDVCAIDGCTRLARTGGVLNCMSWVAP